MTRGVVSRLRVLTEGYKKEATLSSLVQEKWKGLQFKQEPVYIVFLSCFEKQYSILL